MSDHKVRKKIETLGRALSRLKIMIDKPMEEDRSNIDATIQRFEFSIELFWKCLKAILEENGREVSLPKAILQQAYTARLIDDEKVWLDMLKDRNLTAHTYEQELADVIYSHIKGYYPVMKKTFDSIQSQFGDKSDL